MGKNTPQHLRSFRGCWVERPACQSQDGDCVHYSAGGSFAAGGGTTSTFMSLSVYRGRQIKDVSHFRGCKRASGDGSDVSDTPNPPSAASTYRLPIHVSSKATLQTSRIINCPQPRYPSQSLKLAVIPAGRCDFYLVLTCLSSSGNAECGKNMNRLKLEHFRVYQLWHFKLSNEAVTQTGHISVSYTSLLVLLEHHSWAFSNHSAGKKRKSMQGFCWVFPFNILFLVVDLFPEWSQIKPI